MYEIEGPKIAFHGGKCCGIKVIHTLGFDPDRMCKALEKTNCAEVKQNADQYGHDVTSSFNFYTGEAPIESVKDRVKRYIDYLLKVRPHGIIEIVLATSTFKEYDQIVHMSDMVKELGFVEVSSCHNSNSSNRVHVFHLVSDSEG